MIGYLIRRLLYAVPILVGVCFLTFVLFYMTASPADIARRNLSAKNPTAQQIKDWEQQHGYDKPKWKQFLDTTEGLFLLRLGRSDSVKGERVITRIKESWFPSFEIALLSFGAAITINLSLALVVAYFRGTYLDIYGTTLCVFMMSVTYLVYIIGGQFVFGRLLKLNPVAGFLPGWESLRFAFLPVVVAVVSGMGASVRQFRTFMLDEMNQDYVRTARAKGVSESQVLFKHVLKNAAIPVLTTSVQAIPGLFLGSILLESFFNIPGLGNYLVDAINSQDFAVVRAMVFIGALVTIVGYILTDISYALVDKRVRLE